MAEEPEPSNIPLPSDTGIPGSRKIRLKNSLSNSNIKDEEIKETKSSIVDSVFSNFVAKKIEEIEQERKKNDSSSKDKKHKHKKSSKEKHKKHKHKQRDKNKVKNSDSEFSSSEVEESGGGFFAKESFLEPDKNEDSENSNICDNDNNSKNKKHKKHKKKDHKRKHKHKHDKDKSKNDSRKSETHDKHLDGDKSTKSRKKDSSEKSSPKNIFADKFEKAIESKLNSLKENLIKKHKALEDLGKDMTVPEKKIKMMTEITLNEKLKEIKSEERKLSISRNPSEMSQSSENVLDMQKQEKVDCDIKNLGSNVDNRCVSKSRGSLTIQVTEASEDNHDITPEKDEDGFVAMKPRKDREEEAYEKMGTEENKGSTASQLAKKPQGMKLGLKLSENSMSLISSGVKVENNPKKRNREEGEITDSQDSTVSGSSSSATSDTDSNSDDGEIKESSAKKRKKKTKEKDKHNKDKKRKHSRSKSPRRRRRSRSRSYDEQRGVWTTRRRRRSRSRDKGRQSRERDSYHSRRRSRSRSRDRTRYSDRNFYYNDRYKRRSRSRSRERRKSPQDLRLKIDKAKLREIAMKNAYAMLGADEEAVKNLKPDQIAALKAGGKSVEELTNFCRKIAEKDPGRGSSSEDESRRCRVPLSDEEDAPFIHHPFKVNPVAANIALNIRNAKQLPVTSFADRAAKAGELRLQFPVSSGSQHKNKEDEWVPVVKPNSQVAIPATAAPVSAKPVVTATNSAATPKPLPKPGALMPPPLPPAKTESDQTAPTATTTCSKDKVFPEIPKINISDVVSERLSAMRKLQSNPNDVEAIGAMYKSQQAMKTWGEKQAVPGQFTGSTGLKVLSQKQLQGSGFQAWIKKDLFQKAAPMRGGIGKLLLQKMGWKEGTGLGKEESGSVEPLNLEIKCDRKGLLTADEAPPAPVGKTKGAAKAPVVRDLSGKHPVSALIELCKKRKWGQPNFDLVFECGPPHKKNFLVKCTVNNVDYQPTIASPNKKHAKAQAATVVLQTFGLIPKDEVV